MENSIVGLTPPPPFWPKLWKILKNINYFMTSKSGLVAPLLRDTLYSVHYLFMVNFRQLNPLFLFLLE